MAPHEKFHYPTMEELRMQITALGLNIPLDEDLSPLAGQVRIGSFLSPNSMAVLPMEGCDANPDGSPSALTERRYLRMAGGGSGLIWWEACAVVGEGRASERQMILTRDNTGRFAALLRKVKAEASRLNGAAHHLLNILQLTHSGRYSNPHGRKLSPIVPQHDPILDPRVKLAPDAPVVSDDYLDDLIGKYAFSAKLAMEAGFDGVDLKSCHRYLLSELLASHTREGRYGGCFENRTRFLRDAIDAVRSETSDGFIIACRFNVFDAHPYPYGFGGSKDDFWTFDPSEPTALVRMLCGKGIGLLSNSAGNPYYLYPQVTRPFDQNSLGVPVPDEHPLESVARLFEFTRVIQQAAGKIPVVGNGYTWLRQFLPYAAAANLKSNSCQVIGLGRSSFAYPDAPRDIINKGAMDPMKCCTTCSRCTQIMRDHGTTGCAVRDAEVYAPIYKFYRGQAESREGI